MANPSFFIKETPLSVGAMAVFPYSDALYARFWAKDKYTEEPFNISFRRGDKLLVPRELVVGGKDARTLGKSVKFAANFNPPPARNELQQETYEKSLALLTKGRSHIVRASTGFGKTWLGARLIHSLGLKTVVVVTKEDLMGEAQWLGAIKKFAGVPADKIGIIRQDKYDVEGKLVVLAMIHSLAKPDKYPKEMADEFGLVVWDEVHHLSAETFQTTAALFNAKLRLGLSAGVKQNAMRADGRDFVFEAHIGPVAVTAELISMAPKVLVLNTPWKLPLVPWRVNGSYKTIPLPHEAGKLGAVVVDIAKCLPRNDMIATLAWKAWKQGRTVVVLSELAREKHLDMLETLIRLKGVPVEDIGFYIGGMKEKEREATKKKKIILATYGMMAEATDIPWLDTCILATPRSNVKQPIGRILREHENKKRPVVIDLVDIDSDVLKGYFEKRCSLYRSPEIKGEIIYSHM